MAFALVLLGAFVGLIAATLGITVFEIGLAGAGCLLSLSSTLAVLLLGCAAARHRPVRPVLGEHGIRSTAPRGARAASHGSRYGSSAN